MYQLSGPTHKILVESLKFVFNGFGKSKPSILISLISKFEFLNFTI